MITWLIERLFEYMANSKEVCLHVGNNYDLLNAVEKKRLSSINLVIAAVSFITNSYMIFSIINKKQYRIQSIKLSLFLSTFDLLASLVSQPLFTYHMMASYTKLPCLKLCFIQTGEIIFQQMSGNMLGLMVYDRYMHIKYLSRYKEKMTPKRVNIYIVVVIAITVFQSVVRFIGSMFKMPIYVKETPITVLQSMLVLWDLVFYFWSLYILKQHGNDSSDRLQSKIRTLTKLTSYYLIAIATIYFPLITMRIINRSLAPEGIHLVRNLAFPFIFTILLINCNGIVNSLLFLYNHRQFRGIGSKT